MRVNPAYTSQTCNPCGHGAPENRESQSVFRCVACGHQAHADVNAARNILARALRATGRDGPSSPDNNGRISHQGPPLVPRQPPARAVRLGGIPALEGGEDVNLLDRPRRRSRSPAAPWPRPRACTPPSPPRSTPPGSPA
ncbi:zinc ribbon domain-containing protein [Longispora sp. K20-0274]|uniref:zinc ribbon domain-containing protein n=1 Tax=Longispora sp. K20-0274 TaxID=3088255 RepID=UPI00399AE1F3